MKKKSHYLVDVFYGENKLLALEKVEKRIGHYFSLKERVGEPIPDYHPNYRYAFYAQKWRRKVKRTEKDYALPVRRSFWVVKLYRIPKNEIVALQQKDRTFTVKWKEK